MITSIRIKQLATDENFDEDNYLTANPDVADAVRRGQVNSGKFHFDTFGRNEGRQINLENDIEALRTAKMNRATPFLRDDMEHIWRGAKADYLTERLRFETRIVSTSAVSSNDYDSFGVDLIEAHPDGLILDCGAGSRGVYYSNVINYEIVNYPSTDVLGVGENLPFLDNSMDGVISVAVLEHVRDPFKCAKEISRVLKPGGTLYCSVPFLQPYHGYPHHYFNATAQGISRLFEDELVVTDVDVIDSVHPIHALAWILQSWCEGLEPSTLSEFKQMSVEQFLTPPMRLVEQKFCTELTKQKKLELACATILHAHKPL
jgi:SAM-dependent methyltransferase